MKNPRMTFIQKTGCPAYGIAIFNLTWGWFHIWPLYPPWALSLMVPGRQCCVQLCFIPHFTSLNPLEQTSIIKRCYFSLLISSLLVPPIEGTFLSHFITLLPLLLVSALAPSIFHNVFLINSLTLSFHSNFTIHKKIRPNS